MPRRLLDSPWPYFVGAGVLLILAVASQFEIRTPSRPVATPQDILALKQRNDLNVVFILVDTLRSDHLSSYGYPRKTSENIDALAATGIRFANVLSQSSWTKTSMASLWTGTHPKNNRILRYNDVIPTEAMLPAEIFRAAGYRTSGIWRNGWVAPNFGFDQGFEFYMNPKPGRERMRVQGEHPSGRTLQGTDEDIVVSGFEFLDHFGHERFFLYLHLMDVHQYVYDEASAKFGNSYKDVYDQSIHWIDRLIGVIVNRIDSIGVLDRTVIVIASDHGEAFLEHGTEGHARNLYSEVVDVPWVIALPFQLDPGIVVEERVSNLDVWPTVLDLVGLEGLRQPDGRSLMPLVMAAAEGRGEGEAAPPVIAYLDRRWGSPKDSDPLVSVTAGDRRLFWSPKRPQRAELYDLTADPAEKRNLFREGDPDAKHLAALAEQYEKDGKSPWGVDPVQVDLDELRLNQLRALGYVIR